MEFDNSFEVPLPPAQAWKVLLDIERIAPCMPGAELTEIVDKTTYKGKIAVRLGPVALALLKRGLPADTELVTGRQAAVAAVIDADSLPPPEQIRAGRLAVERLRGGAR